MQRTQTGLLVNNIDGGIGRPIEQIADNDLAMKAFRGQSGFLKLSCTGRKIDAHYAEPQFGQTLKLGRSSTTGNYNGALLQAQPRLPSSKGRV